MENIASRYQRTSNDSSFRFITISVASTHPAVLINLTLCLNEAIWTSIIYGDQIPTMPSLLQRRNDTTGV